MKRLFFLPILLGILATGCSNDDDKKDNDLTPIVLSSRVDIEPRVGQDTQIAKDQELSLFVTKSASISDIVYNNVILKADGNGGFDYFIGEEINLYYPLDNDPIDFYAIHPYFSGMSVGNISDFSVKTDQTILSNFLNSDLLYSQKKDVVKGTNPVSLLFYHKLSKITFTVKAGQGVSLENLSEVDILNLLPQTTINPVNGDITAAVGTSATIKAYNVLGSTESQITGISAIVVPQTFTADTENGKRLFRFLVDEKEFFYTPRTDMVFESGKKYNYVITITNSGLEVTSSIEDWLSTDDIEGEGTID